MDWPYVHLIVSHFPTVLSVVGAAFALIALVNRRRYFWMFAMTCLLIAGIAAYPAVLTGQQAEHTMERSWFVTRESIHTHEEAAELAMWIMIATGIMSAYGLYSATRPAAPGRSSFPGWLQALVLLGALASAATVSLTAYDGERIVHEAPALLKAPR